MIVPRKIIFVWGLFLPFLVLAPHDPIFLKISLVFIAMLLVLSLTDALTAVSLKGSIHVSAPEICHIHLMREETLSLEISNDSQRSFDLLLNPSLPYRIRGKEAFYEMRLHGTSRNSFSLECVAERRGSFKYSFCMIEFPSLLGLWSYRKKAGLNCEIRVYPDLRKERKTLNAVISAFLNGVRSQQIVGQGRDFERLRDYQAGDSYDSMAWKATARKGRPVSKVFQAERTLKIYAAIDVSRLSGKLSSDGAPAIERFLSAALILGTAAERQGDLFGIIAFDEQVRRFIRASSGRPHHIACRDAVFSLESGMQSPFFENLFSFIRTKIRTRSIIFFLTDLGDPSIAESFASEIKLLSVQHLCMVNSIKDPRSSPIFEEGIGEEGEIPSALAGHISWMRLAALRRELANSGVRAVLSSHESFTSSLLGSYMDLKRRQLA